MLNFFLPSPPIGLRQFNFPPIIRILEKQFFILTRSIYFCSLLPPKYELRLSASDNLRENHTTVVIHVKDVNDNPPVFERPTYRTQITEEDDRTLPKSVVQVEFLCLILKIIFFEIGNVFILRLTFFHCTLRSVFFFFFYFTRVVNIFLRSIFRYIKPYGFRLASFSLLVKSCLCRPVLLHIVNFFSNMICNQPSPRTFRSFILLIL